MTASKQTWGYGLPDQTEHIAPLPAAGRWTKLLVNLGRELSGRLRRANRTIYQLAS